MAIKLSTEKHSRSSNITNTSGGDSVGHGHGHGGANGIRNGTAAPQATGAMGPVSTSAKPPATTATPNASQLTGLSIGANFRDANLFS